MSLSGPPPSYGNIQKTNSGHLQPNPYNTTFQPTKTQSATLPPPNVQTKLNLEVKLYSNNREREHFDNLGDLYSIIRTCEALEKAYVRDAISSEE